MDIVHGLSTISQVVGSGLGVWAITEIVKKAKSIPWVNSGDTTVLRSIAAALSAASVVLLGFVNKDLSPNDLQTAIQAVLAVGVAWGTAHGAHKTVTTLTSDK